MAGTGITTYLYQPGAMLTVDPLGVITTQTVDANFDLSSVTSNYTHDANGNLIKVVEPTGAPFTLSYDNENRLRGHANAATITTYAYQYDGMKRTESVGCPPGRPTARWMEYPGNPPLAQ